MNSITQSIASLAIIMCTSLFHPVSQADSIQLAAIDEAFNTQNTSQLEAFSQSLHGFDQFIAQYRLASALLISQKTGDAKIELNRLVTTLEAYTAQTPSDAEAMALLANVYGFSIGVDSAKAATYGPRAQTTMQQALSLAPNNALVLFFKATLDYNTPTMFGGSKVKAQAVLAKSLAAYPETEESDRYWGHADALVLMGLTHLEQGNKKAAQQYWQQALTLTPNHAWANYLIAQHISLSNK